MLNIRKKIFLLLLCVFLLVFTGCASDDIADKVVKENIDDLYLVILGEDIAKSIDVNNLTVSVNEFDKTYTSRKHKLIVVTDSYAQNITSEQVSNLKNLITKDKYWVLYHCNDTSKVNSFAHNFGKAVSSTEQSYLIGYTLIYNKTQSSLQGIPSYSTSNTFGIKELNNTIKQTYRDMIENRYEDNAFCVYDISGINFYNEYSVRNLEQEVIIYFPVVSNKMITSTQLGGIATLLNLKTTNDNNEQQSVKVKLIAQKQDKLNTEYQNFYISFLKYKLEIDNTVDLSLYSSIDLCDTTIWVYSEEEYQTLKFNDTYMRINIIDSNNSLSTPQWDQVLLNMQNEIKEKLI